MRLQRRFNDLNLFSAVPPFSLVGVVVCGRRALLIVAYGPMEVEEVSVLVGSSRVQELDLEEEVELLVVELVPEVVDCPLVLEPKDLAWYTCSFSIRASLAVIQLR